MSHLQKVDHKIFLRLEKKGPASVGHWHSHVSLTPLRAQKCTGTDYITDVALDNLIEEGREVDALIILNKREYRLLQGALEGARKDDLLHILTIEPESLFLLNTGFMERDQILTDSRNDPAVKARSKLVELEALEDDFDSFFTSHKLRHSASHDSLERRIIRRCSNEIQSKLVRSLEQKSPELLIPPWGSKKRMNAILAFNESAFKEWEKRFRIECENYTKHRGLEELGEKPIKPWRKRKEFSYRRIKREVDTLMREKPDLTRKEAFQIKAEELGKSFEAVQRSYYYDPKSAINLQKKLRN